MVYRTSLVDSGKIGLFHLHGTYNLLGAPLIKLASTDIMYYQVKVSSYCCHNLFRWT
jgi:hypothetical protein